MPLDKDKLESVTSDRLFRGGEKNEKEIKYFDLSTFFDPGVKFC